MAQWTPEFLPKSIHGRGEATGRACSFRAASGGGVGGFDDTGAVTTEYSKAMATSLERAQWASPDFQSWHS